MIRRMLTTIDNPHSPFDDFKAWYAFDVAHGYYTSALLGRITVSSEELSEADQVLANEQAIEEAMQENVTGMFRIVTKEFPDDD